MNIARQGKKRISPRMHRIVVRADVLPEPDKSDLSNHYGDESREAAVIPDCITTR